MKQLVPILWLVLLVGLGVRGIVRDDARYAWGMFPYVLRYQLDYRWRLDDGTTLAYAPGRELRRAKKALAAGRTRDSMYGIGAVRAEVDAYARRMWSSPARPPHARAFEAELTWRKHEHGDPHTEVRSAP